MGTWSTTSCWKSCPEIPLSWDWYVTMEKTAATPEAIIMGKVRLPCTPLTVAPSVVS